MSRIRICQLITELRPAGAERSVYQLSTRLDPSRFDVRVIALRGGAVADMLRDAGIETTVIDMRGKWDVAKIVRLERQLRRRPVDILHTHLFHADMAGRLAASFTGVRHIVHTVHTAEGRFRPWQYWFARLFGERCRRIICVSPSVKECHARRSGLPDWRYTVIPNGVDAEEFQRDDDARRRLREQWGVSPDQVLPAYVGRLAPEKGIETLIAAMSHLGARGNPMPLVLAGDGPQRRLVENFIAHGEGGTLTRMLGFVKDVRGVLSAADMLIMPSRWEGWPLTASEAMAAELPVIGTDVPGIRDVVVDGETGVLVPSGDVVTLAETIERFAEDSDLRRRMGAAGRKRVRESFTIDKTIAAHEQLYEEIIGARS